jgi:hypothetical protein
MTEHGGRCLNPCLNLNLRPARDFLSCPRRRRADWLALCLAHPQPACVLRHHHSQPPLRSLLRNVPDRPTRQAPTAESRFSSQPSSQRPRPADTPSAHGREPFSSQPSSQRPRPADGSPSMPCSICGCRGHNRTYACHSCWLPPLPPPPPQSLLSRWLLRADDPSVSGWPSPHREDVSEHRCSSTEQQAPSRAKGSSSIRSRLSTHPAAARGDSPSFRDRGRQLDCGADDCVWIHLAGTPEQGMSTLLNVTCLSDG